MSENLNSWQLQAIQFNSWQNNCCQDQLITPFGLPQNSFCCQIIAPVSPVSQNLSGYCTNIDCSPYSPVCFTVSGTNLCNYLAGIDVAICTIQTSLSNIPCTAISVGSGYTCIVGLNSSTSYNLCQWTAALNATLCAINNKVNFIGSGGGITRGGSGGITSGGGGLVTDGGGGTFTSGGGLSFGLVTGAIVSNPAHGNSTGSLQITG